MARIRIKRGTRAQINAAAVAGTLNIGEPYLLTDEGRMAIATSVNDFAVAEKQGAPETIFPLTGATPVISPTNGSIQPWVLTANSTPTLGTWAAGAGLALQVHYNTFTVSWPAITWLTPDGLAPDPSKYVGKIVVCSLYKIGTTVYGI